MWIPIESSVLVWYFSYINHFIKTKIIYRFTYLMAITRSHTNLVYTKRD